MFDSDDAGDITLAAVVTTPATWVGLGICIVVALIAYHFAYANQQECRKRACDVGSEPRLIDHECLCVAPAR